MDNVAIFVERGLWQVRDCWEFGGAGPWRSSTSYDEVREMDCQGRVMGGRASQVCKGLRRQRVRGSLCGFKSSALKGFMKQTVKRDSDETGRTLLKRCTVAGTVWIVAL